MVRVINWKATNSETLFVAECHQDRDCRASNETWKGLIDEIKKQSKSKMGSCKVIITYYFDIE